MLYSDLTSLSALYCYALLILLIFLPLIGIFITRNKLLNLKKIIKKKIKQSGKKGVSIEAQTSRSSDNNLHL